MRTFAAAAVSLALLLPDGNHAAEGAAPPATAAPEPAPAAAPAPPGASAATAPARVPDLTIKAPPDLDFILLDQRLTEPPADKALEAAVSRRRSLLQAHQAAGLATWALMGTTVVYGRLDYKDKFLGAGTGKYTSTHKGLGYATASAFAFTGLLAALAPAPYPKRLRFDTATIHKTSMALATVGVVSQIVLGIGIRRGLGNLEQRQIANAHQAVGLGTFAAMSVGAITLVF